MKGLMDTLLSSTFNLVKRVPSKLNDYDMKIADQKHEGKNENHQKQQYSLKLFKRTTKDVRERIKEKFVDSFRKFVDFSIPPLVSGDKDYEEFADDPKIPLLAAVTKIYQRTRFEISTFPGAIVLLRRMFGDENDKKKDGKGCSEEVKRKISVNNMHRILTVSLLVADKYIEDMPASNYDFAVSIGFKPEIVNEFEIEFLECLNYCSYITSDEIKEVLNEWGIST